MLTQNDLIQIKTVVENVFDDKFKKELKPINARFDKIDNKLIEHDAEFDKIDKKLTKHDTEFKTVNKQLRKIKKDLTITIRFFDHNCITHKKHLDRIEQRLGLPQFPIV